MIVHNDPLEYLKNLDEGSSFHNTRGSLLKKPIYTTNNMFECKMSKSKKTNLGLKMSKLGKPAEGLNKTPVKGKDFVSG
jgi:hypothetical protein